MELTRYVSPLGTIFLAADNGALAGLWLEGQKYFAATLDEAAVERDDLPVFRQAAAWLDAYFAKQPLPDLPPLAPRGSDFRQAVWRLLLEIPYGQVTTYGALAQILRDRGISAAAQAVGGAVGHNPISILIPCHRVVGADGSLTGYAGGVEKKRFLLALEGVDMTNLYMPKRGTALCPFRRSLYLQTNAPGGNIPAGGTFIYLYRIMQISPPLPSLMMRVNVSCSFFRASSGIRFSLVCRSSLTTS